MTPRDRAVVASMLALGACLSSNQPADAQVYEGPVTILQHSESSAGRDERIVGYIYVPAHPDERAPYLEQAVFLPGYRDPSSNPGIVTVMAPFSGSREEAFSAMATATKVDGATLRVISARRFEIGAKLPASEDDPWSGLLDWLWRSLGDEVNPAAEVRCTHTAAMESPAEPAAKAFDVIQFPRSNPHSRKLVGHICAGAEDRFLPQAGTWTVSDQFKYLRPSSEMLTEIAPASDSEAACGSDGEAVIPSAAGHGIRTEPLGEDDEAFIGMWARFRERGLPAGQANRAAVIPHPVSEKLLDVAVRWILLDP